MLKWWLKLLMAIKIWYIERKQEWVLSLPLLMEIAEICDPELLKGYTPIIGGKVKLTVAFDNPIIAIGWIDACVDLINLHVPEGEIHRKYLPDIMLLALSNRRMVTLDEWLASSPTGVVDPVDLLMAIRERLAKLNAAFEANKNDPTFSVYYPRKTEAIYSDMFSILEGLLNVARVA